jgi:hypothetical protein
MSLEGYEKLFIDTNTNIIAKTIPSTMITPLNIFIVCFLLDSHSYYF